MSFLILTEICHIKIICTGSVPVSKRHFGGLTAGPALKYLVGGKRGAPVSATAAAAQATMGAEAQKSAQVSYGQVTRMAAVATGASKDVATSLLLSRVVVGGDGGGGDGGGAVDGGSVNAFLAAALTRVMRTVVSIPAVTSASLLHSAAVGGSVVGL